MYILDVIPLTNIPRPNNPVFTYYYAKPLARFSLAWVLVGRKKMPALVLDAHSMRDVKQYLRKSSTYTLKDIKGVVQQNPVLFAWQFELATWLADYYWTSLGSVLKKFIPAYATNNLQLTTYNLRPDSDKEVSRNQRLFLFPDASFFDRVTLPDEAARLSSALPKKKEFLLFQKIAAGKTFDIAGTKRAIFAPFNKLKEIHIYEEADSNHKSWEQRPRFNAVTVAQELARLHHATITYHSSLPSVAAYANKTPYKPLWKNTARTLPSVSLIDLTKEKLNSPFSKHIGTLLRSIHESGKRAILYVNRRGRDRLLLCRDCGYVPYCPNCSTALVLHAWVKGRPMKTLLCHHCAYQEKPPSLCAQCGSHQVRLYGFGTERVEQELQKLFGKARIYRLDSDRVINDRMKRDFVGAFAREGQFLVATSMLFSNRQESVDLVVALNPDSELNIPDFAQNEKLFFNLWRLRNWASTALYVQTYNPDSLLMSALVSGEWQQFYDDELAVRQTLSYPPFSSIIKLTYEHANEARARQEVRALYDALAGQATNETVQLLGPAPAFPARVKGKYRCTILIKLLPTSYKLKAILLSLVPASWDVDVDPVDSL